MTITPMNAARVANARRHVAEILAGRMCPNPEHAAQHVVDELRKLGWAPPGWHINEGAPRPSYSTAEGRRRAREIFEQTRAEARTDTATTSKES